GQRRAGLVSGERRRRPAVQSARAGTGVCNPLRHRADGGRPNAGGSDSHLRYHQHDRRRGRAVSEPSEKTAAKGEGGKPGPGAPTNVPGGTGTKPPPPPPPPAGKPPAPPHKPGLFPLTTDRAREGGTPGTHMNKSGKQ